MKLRSIIRTAAAFVLFIAAITVGPSYASAAFPGGFLESATSTNVRPTYSAADIQSFLPAGRGVFTFPAPYNTQGVRLTVPSDCGGADCVFSIGYSYWRNTNNHRNSDTMLIFLGLNANRGGTGPTLFSFNKITNEVQKLGPLFNSASRYYLHSTEGWYFSATQPNAMYVTFYESAFHRFDVMTKTMSTVYDVSGRFGSDKYIEQAHSSGDDLTHSATLVCRNAGCSDGTHVSQASDEMMGCLVYQEAKGQFLYYPRAGDFNECAIDMSGRWLTTFEDLRGIDGVNHVDNRVIDVTTGYTRNVLMDDHVNGSVAHHDTGYGYIVGGNSGNPLANAKVVYRYGQDPLQQTLESYTVSWGAPTPIHLAHGNARQDLPPEQQYVCGSASNRTNVTRANEVVCFPMDGSLNVLVVAPVMTNMDAFGGDGNGCGDYCKYPKGNLDVTGGYFIWSTNMGGDRQDIFIAKVPAQLMPGMPVDSGSTGTTTPPTGGTTMPAISGLSAPVITASDATVTWATNVATDSQVEYGTTTAYGSATTVNGNLVVSHSQAIGTLAASTTYHYRVKSTDTSGNLAVSADATLTTLASPTTNNNGLIVTVTSPLSGALVKGKIRLTATVSNSAGLAGLQFKVDGQNLGSEDITSPYSVVWNTATVTNGDHTITAVVRDSNGNLTASAPVTINVKGSRLRTTATASRQNVVWMNTVNTDVAGNSIQEACGGCGNSGAQSVQHISSGNGYVEFTATETSTQRAIGLARGNSDNGRDDIDYAVMLWDGGSIAVYEKGVYRSGDISYAPGDVFRIAVEFGVVKYLKNGSVFYTSTTRPRYPLLIDTAFFGPQSSIANAVIYAAG